MPGSAWQLKIPSTSLFIQCIMYICSGFYSSRSVELEQQGYFTLHLSSSTMHTQWSCLLTAEAWRKITDSIQHVHFIQRKYSCVFVVQRSCSLHYMKNIFSFLVLSKYLLVMMHGSAIFRSGMDFKGGSVQKKKAVRSP